MDKVAIEVKRAIRESMAFEQAQQERVSFLESYAGRGKEFAFIHSLVTGRIEDCVKDVRVGLITQDRATELLDDAESVCPAQVAWVRERIV